MRQLVTAFDRLMPALLMAASVTLLTAGLLSYAPSTFGDTATPDADLIAGDPLLTLPSELNGDPPPTGQMPRADASGGPSFELPPTPTPSTNAGATPSEIPTGSLDPTGEPTSEPPDHRPGRASRIRIVSLGIDLPVVPSDLLVRGNPDFYPLCDVAMFMRAYVNPGEIGATYIYAHAQRGMFAPLLKASQVDDGRSMFGALIEVYTTDNKLHLYELYKVKRHATDLSLAHPPLGEHRLVLQTSEGPTGHIPKLQVAARPISVVPASRAEARPEANPRVCAPH